LKQSLYLEDLQVGQIFASSAITITTEAIKTFARQFDPQPFHLDAKLAAESFFKQLVASGWHTASITMRLMVESIPITGGLIGAGVDELRWHCPVLPGDSLSVKSEILSIRSSQKRGNQGLVRFKHTTFNQHEFAVLTFISTTVVPKRPEEDT